jgi:hypothetical protein
VEPEADGEAGGHGDGQAPDLHGGVGQGPAGQTGASGDGQGPQPVDEPSPTGEPLSPTETVAMLRDYYASMPPDQFPNVLATLDELFSGGPQERFQLGLDVILRGLASYARS